MRTALAGVATALLCLIAEPAAAQDNALVADLEQRLMRNGRQPVYAHLRSNWSATMVPLNQLTTGCEFDAVELSVKLDRGAEGKVAQALGDSIRTATGNCMGFVLSQLMREEIPKYCRSVAAWTSMRTVRELRRRIAMIEADEALRNGELGKACHAAYWHELRNTRVGLRVAPVNKPSASTTMP
jgi:hypothetical protein